MKTIGFVTFEKYHAKSNIGSSRIRGRWVWEKINEIFPDEYKAEEFVFGKKYDVVIFQKAYWVEYAKNFTGLKILDLCDPDWLHWGSNMVEMIQEVDLITCSSVEITEYVQKLTDKPVFYIPDTIKIEDIKRTKEHKGQLKRVAWFGYSHNFPIIDWTIKSLDNRNLELIVISDNAYRPPVGINNVNVINYKWSEEVIYDDLLKADVVLNPKKNSGRFKYKSNNKSLVAWALGLPVIEKDEDFDKFKEEESRKKESESVRRLVREHYSSDKHAKELVSLIKKYEKENN